MISMSREMPDASGCDEQEAVNHNPDLAASFHLCACGSYGELIKTSRNWGSDGIDVTRRTVRHHWTLEPHYEFDPDAIAVVGATVLGPGLTKEYPKHRTMIHKTVDGVGLVEGTEELRIDYP